MNNPKTRKGSSTSLKPPSLKYSAVPSQLVIASTSILKGEGQAHNRFVVLTVTDCRLKETNCCASTNSVCSKLWIVIA